jgi:hypothetical protein
MYRVQKYRIAGRPSPLWLLLFVVFFGFFKPASSISAEGNPAPAAETAPAGTIIPLQLKNTINSKTAFGGQNVYCETIFPVALNNHILIPAHSFVRGHVTEVDPPGRILGKAQLGIRMDSLIFPDGRTWPIRSAVYSLAGARLSPDEAKKENGDVGNVGKVKPDSSAEGLIDASGLADASSISGVSEGVGGLILLLVTRGKRIVLQPGTTLEIRLDAPLNFADPPPSSAEPEIPRLKSRPPCISLQPVAARH